MAIGRPWPAATAAATTAAAATSPGCCCGDPGPSSLTSADRSGIAEPPPSLPSLDELGGEVGDDWNGNVWGNGSFAEAVWPRINGGSGGPCELDGRGTRLLSWVGPPYTGVSAGWLCSCGPRMAIGRPRPTVAVATAAATASISSGRRRGGPDPLLSSPANRSGISKSPPPLLLLDGRGGDVWNNWDGNVWGNGLCSEVV